MSTYTISKIQLPNGDICIIKDTDTTYTFSSGEEVNELSITATNSSGSTTSTVVLPGIEVVRL